MAPTAKPSGSNLLTILIQSNYLFRGMDEAWLAAYLAPETLEREKLFSNRPIYTANRPGESINTLYVLLSGGPVIARSSPLDRVVSITYPGGCFGMRNLPLGYGLVSQPFPYLIETYKTTDVVKIPLETVRSIYQNDESFHIRYDLLFELRERFQYHLLNCSTYPPQAVASLLRALVHQEQALGNQPDSDSTYMFDLPIDIIARASQLNHRTVEQVLKGMQKVGMLAPQQPDDPSADTVRVVDLDLLQETYSATRDKVPWWPLR